MRCARSEVDSITGPAWAQIRDRCFDRPHGGVTRARTPPRRSRARRRAQGRPRCTRSCSLQRRAHTPEQIRNARHRAGPRSIRHGSHVGVTQARNPPRCSCGPRARRRARNSAGRDTRGRARYSGEPRFLGRSKTRDTAQVRDRFDHRPRVGIDPMLSPVPRGRNSGANAAAVLVRTARSTSCSLQRRSRCTRSCSLQR
jgi:hypothetical protein